MLEFVHPVEQMEMKIDKLVLCEPANTVVSLTRGGLGFWCMDTGALKDRIADTTGGKDWAGKKATIQFFNQNF